MLIDGSALADAVVISSLLWVYVLFFSSQDPFYEVMSTVWCTLDSQMGLVKKKMSPDPQNVYFLGLRE